MKNVHIFLENPGFEGYPVQYETFSDEPNNMELEDLDDSSEGPDEAINQGFEHDLISSLPSSHFRVIKNMAVAGKANTECEQCFLKISFRAKMQDPFSVDPRNSFHVLLV